VHAAAAGVPHPDGQGGHQEYMLSKGRLGWTALQCAAQEGHTAVVQLLLDAGAAVDVVAADGHTALHRAACGGQTAVVQLLLNAHASVHVVKKGSKLTALHEAA
jgi:ankyrin repeat protein